MSKRQYRPQASSSRAVSGAFGAGFGSPMPSSGFGTTASPLSYIGEPPNLSSISDPNIVVAFKNLSKKDSTTKAKALEDLQAYVSSSSGEVEEAVLEAWIKLYPRTSIDSSRRVRQLAHTFHGLISVSCGKRIAKHMPKVIGAWLSGLYDSDRSVAKATQDALQQVFPSPEKLQNVRKAYQQPILEYCRDVIDNETVQTLSDKRTVSPDDAEAKYSRVLATSIAVTTSLLTDLSTQDIARHQELYDGLIQGEKLWDFATYSDALVKRSVHRLLRICLTKQYKAVTASLDIIGSGYLGKALSSDQTGSSYDYSETLLALTLSHPTVWTDHYKSKKPVMLRLRQFIKRGSQAGPPSFWENVNKIFQSLPREVLPKEPGELMELLNAVHSGITKDEPRANLSSAFSTYIDIVALSVQTFPEQDYSSVLRESVLPLITQYIKPIPENSQWTIPGPQAATILAQIRKIPAMTSVLESEWPKISSTLVEDIKTSLPEQSKQFDKSQAAVSDEGTQWVSFQAEVLRASSDSETGDPFRPIFVSSLPHVLEEALTVLKARNSKPYGAAGVVEAVVKATKVTFWGEQRAIELINTFVAKDVPNLVVSPSYKQLIAILYAYQSSDVFRDAWTATLHTILGASDMSLKATALQEFLSSMQTGQVTELASASPKLQNYIVEQSHQALSGNEDWSFISRIMKRASTVLSADTTDELLAGMVEALTIEDKTRNALHGLEQITKDSPAAMKQLLQKPEGSRVLSTVLGLTEAPEDDVAQAASDLNTSMHKLLSSSEGDVGSQQAMFDIIRSGLNEATPHSVSVETLVDLAQKFLQGTELKTSELLERMLPDNDRWTQALTRFLAIPPRPALAITNPLGGAVYFVESSSVDGGSNTDRTVPRDADGYSDALRMAMYTVKLLKDSNTFESISPTKREEIFGQLLLSAQLASDNLGLAGANHFWATYSSEAMSEILDFVSEAQSLITHVIRESSSWWTGEEPSSQYAFVENAIDSLHQSTTGNTPSAYHNARVYSTTVAELVEMHGWQSRKTQELEDRLKSLRRTKEILSMTSFLAAFRVPLSGNSVSTRFCNELVADLTGLDIHQKPKQGLRQLVLLNAIIQNQDDASETIAKQRLIFFVKHVTPWLQDSTTSLPIQAETCRALIVLLPLMQDIYGSHWTELLEYLTGLWSSAKIFDDSTLPVIHTSLKLFNTLRRMKMGDDANEDLVDAWKESEGGTARGLLNLLKQSQSVRDEHHQPARIVNELLARQISRVAPENLEDASELFPLLYAESSSAQQTAFGILHKHIPAAQEPISLDAALEKRVARLPEELLSLILEAPAVDPLNSMKLEGNVPLPLRGYLISWLLVFDHFQNSSYKVKIDYIENIKDGDYITGLLDFMFDFLGHGQGKPVDVSKLDITTYEPDMQDSPMRDVQWLLTHLYYLCLVHVPSLAKAWWIDCKSRQKVIAVESWTEKYISPHVISAALTSVSDWAASQDTTSEEALSIKVSQRGKEVTASYLIDEQQTSIRISLPPTYPLRQAIVEGLARVAVDERKWQSWLRNTQGVIAFSNGNLMDGLVAWRKNVVGALKGQTECAICYSIVGPEGRLPSKRCGTCKKLFHSSCLYRWFKTSNGSSCPLCRNAFNYG